MNTKQVYHLVCLTGLLNIMSVNAQDFQVISPDKNISITIQSGDRLMWSATFNQRMIMDVSQLGFEFTGEPAMTGNFAITGQETRTIHETWKPVVRSKHAAILDHCNELHLFLKEKTAGTHPTVFIYIRGFVHFIINGSNAG